MLARAWAGSLETVMSTPAATTLSRRRLFAGAGTAGALATVVAVLPLQQQAPPTVDAPKPAPDAGGGYQLSAHVQRYYQTAKL
jgi:hypothetical protein